MKGYRLFGLRVGVLRQQFSQTRAQPPLIFQGHDGDRDGNAEEQGDIEIGQDELGRERIVEQQRIDNTITHADTAEQ